MTAPKKAIPFLAALLCAAATSAPDPARAEDVATRVFLNGVPTPVYFNDGDSFRVLGGPHAGTRARLAGFNTLETFGPVHKWGTWHPKELYVLSKMATLNAMRGVWHCTSEMEQDTYGRILWHCPDLGLDQVRRGLAHALSVDETPADPELLVAQAEAIAAGRGMWAHGAPAYVLTSLHSIAEGNTKDGMVYNRLVSARDGHSASMRHGEDYAECAWVCAKETQVDAATLEAAVALLKEDPTVAAVVTEMGDARALQVVEDYAKLGWFVPGAQESHEAALTQALATLKEGGHLGAGEALDASCGLYVPFERRYGKARPDCLR